jgi:hypothetical protein
LLALVSFYLPFLTGSQSFYLSDVTYYFEPFLKFISRALSQNQLPLWNPYCFCGMPQIAIPSPGIFYPPDWLFAFLPFSQSLAVYLIFHQFAAGIGGYLLIAGLGWGAFAASSAGVALALCGYMFSLQKNFSLVASACWLPLAIWSVRSIQTGGSASHFVRLILASLVIFALIAAGRPDITVPSFAILIAYIMLSAYSDQRDDRLGGVGVKILVWRLTAVVTALLLAAPIILPALEWTALSPRSHGLAANEALIWSTNWYDLLAIVMPQPLGDLDLIGSPYLQMVATRAGYIPFLSSAFLGPVVITLAIWGVMDRNWRGRYLALALFGVSLLAALGNMTPLLPMLLNTLPALSIFRYPVKLIIIPVWCLCFLAARGAAAAVSWKCEQASQVVAWSFWSMFLLASLVLSCTPELGWILPHLRLLQLPLVDVRVIANGLGQIGRTGLLTSLSGLFTCALAHLYWQKKLSRPVFTAVVLSSIFASQLACAFMYSKHGAESGYFRHGSAMYDEITKLATKDRETHYRFLPLYFDPISRPALYQGKTPEHTTALYYQYARQLLLPNTNIEFQMRSAFGYEAAETGDYKKLFNSAYREYMAYVHEFERSGRTTHKLLLLARFCQITATKYVCTQCYNDTGYLPLLDGEFFTLAIENRTLNYRIYRLNLPVRRAYLSGRWKWCDSHDGALNTLELPDMSGFDPANATILEHHSPYSAVEDLKKPQIEPAALKSSWLAIMQDTAEHVSLSVNTPAPCFLVLTDHFYPGWIARLDGIPCELYCANAVERAVYLPKGPHLVDFDYIPDSLFDGMKLAALALIILAVFVAIAVFIKLAESVSPPNSETKP